MFFGSHAPMNRSNPALHRHPASLEAGSEFGPHFGHPVFGTAVPELPATQ